MRIHGCVLLLGFAGCVQAAYTPYVQDSLAATTGWSVNGSVSNSSAGMTSSSGGSMIWGTAAPTYPNDYKIQANINLQNGTSGGSYGIMLRASPGSYTNGTTAFGTFYMVELQNVIFSGGVCSADLRVWKSISGTPTTLSVSSFACSSLVQLAATINGPTIVILINGQFLFAANDSSITSGQPGVNVHGATAGNTISWATLYHGDKTAPAAIDLSNLATSSYADRIDMQWKQPADDADGSGVSFYVMFRGPANIAGFPANIGEFSDYFSGPGVLPGTYTYTILSCDQFYNCSTTVFTATTAPAGSTDPRQVGLRPTGTSWGGGGENINILSGNLNYTLPLLTAKGRGGLTLPIGLNYNSQNWRKDIATWNYGRDIGYGYGMKLGVGSIQMFVNDSWIVDHYTFTDSTGAQYRLRTQVVSIADQTPTSTNTGIWATTTDSVPFIFDANTRKLYFPNGTWWFFGCTSFGNEGDATSMYPTLIQDSNGNQIIIRYKQGVSAVDTLGNNVYVAWSNSSGRIDQIEDVRAIYNGSTYATYQFNYNNDPGVPHLTSITNSISTAEGYTFTYGGSVALTSPWGTSFGNTTKLTGMTISGVGSGYSFEYDPLDSYGSAITKVKFPYGGWLRWAYADGTYSASRVQKEVANRYLSKDGSTETGAYAFTATHDASPGTMRQAVTFNDPGGIGQKVWTFNTSGSSIGLISQYKGNDRSSGTVTLQQVDTTWASAAFGPYISATLTTMNPGVGGAVAKKVEQTLDTWGNLTQMKVSDYSNVVRRTYDMTYLSTTPYASRYIRNRLLTAQVTEGMTVVGLATNIYDSYGGSMITAFTPRQFDATYTTSFIYRGNVTQTANVSGTTGVVQCDNTGNVLQTVDAAGVVSSTGVTSTTNYAAPSSITVGSLTSNFQYAPDLLPTQAQGPNGDTATTTYDSYARPSIVTSKTGAITYFNYTNFNTTTLAPAQTLSYANGRVTRSTLDGFGRPTKAERGTGTRNGTTGAITLATVLSTVDSQYDPCGCSPLGKLSKTSRPYAPAGTVYWTIYGYDGIGRTLSIKAPDGASTTSYSYLGAKVTVTDAAAKTKSFITDEVGNLTQVQETDPTLGAVNTNYTYDILNHLHTVSMQRGATTQTRTFNYSGTLLTSATNPENGTVTNYYNTDRTLNYKADAKGQAIVYSYDSYKRVTQVSKYPGGYTPGGGSNVEDVCQRVNYYYDSNPDTTNTNYTQYIAGRLTSVHYAGAGCQTYNGTLTSSYTGNNYIEMYAYSQAGQVLRKTMRLWKKMYPGTYSPSADLEAVYTYDGEGKMLTQSYPLGTTYSYTFDGMGRPTKMTDTGTSTDLVSTVSYGPAGELISMSGTSVSESRTYNSMGQLTQLTGLSGVNIKYNYPAAGANNGQIASQQDVASGETISYVYDSLKRLSSATSTASWNQSFGYDGFGNLTSKTGSGVAPVGSYPTDAASNRLSGVGLYDNNGNQLWANSSQLVYDVANRMTSSSSLSLAGLNEYDPSNKRVYQQKQHFNGSIWVIDTTEFYFYGVTGQKLGMYWATVSGSGGSASISWTAISTQVFFQSRLVQRSGSPVQMNRVGSIGNYYSYGEERGTTPDDIIKFATYTRDSVSGLDYADQRYAIPGLGRFASSDRYKASSQPSDPQSWNHFVYAKGDPIKFNDPRGQDICIPLDIGTFCIADPESVDVTATPDDVLPTGEALFPINAIPKRYRDLNVNPLVNMYENYFNQGLQAAADLLRSNADCMNLFVLGYGNPVDTLTSLINSNDIGFGKVSDPDAIAQTQRLLSLTGTTTPLITIDPIAFGAETPLLRALTIIHELGHAFYMIYGAGSTAIAADGVRGVPADINTAVSYSN